MYSRTYLWKVCLFVDSDEKQFLRAISVSKICIYTALFIALSLCCVSVTLSRAVRTLKAEQCLSCLSVSVTGASTHTEKPSHCMCTQLVCIMYIDSWMSRVKTVRRSTYQILWLNVQHDNKHALAIHSLPLWRNAAVNKPTPLLVNMSITF